MAMENKKQLLLIGFAVVMGIGATALISTYMTQSIQQQTMQLKEDYDVKQKEMVAALQQQTEQRIGEMAQEMNRAKVQAQEEVQKQIADLQTRMQAQQQAAPEAESRKIKPSLAVKTPAGKRALTVMVDSLAAVGGLLNPGDVVDVIAHLNVPAGGKNDKKNSVTAMIFQSLEVLAVNTNLDETGAYYDEQQNSNSVKITVAVDPQESGLLSFADKNGKLELALRSPDERDKQMVKASTWKTLADYVLENEGANIELPDELKGIVTEKAQNKDKPIQIFRGGKEL